MYIYIHICINLGIYGDAFKGGEYKQAAVAYTEPLALIASVYNIHAYIHACYMHTLKQTDIHTYMYTYMYM